MKKILLTFLLSLLFISCGKNDESKNANETETKTEKIAETPKEKGPVLQLKYKFKKVINFLINFKPKQ